MRILCLFGIHKWISTFFSKDAELNQTVYTPQCQRCGRWNTKKSLVIPGR